MDKLVYTAATGLRAHMAAQAAIANNMANASTTGFRADRVVFDRLNLKGDGSTIEARAPTSEEVTDADRSPGAIPTLPPYQSLTISADGTISIVPQGGDAKDTQVIDKLKLADTKGSDTVKGLDNLLRVRGGGALPEDMDAKVQGGAIEGSNVNMTQALVDMIENQRSYEVQANMMKSAKEIDESGASLMRLPS
jgi:flagellar basal-body rod protein FlgF